MGNLKSSTLYSFDLFDTLVARPLSTPRDVFSLLEKGTTYRLPLLGLLGFRRLRIAAERVARLLAPREEISLADIYHVLGLALRDPARAMRREVSLELALLRPIPENVERIRALAAQGETCCVTTDMYMPLPIIRRVVRQHVGNFECHASSKIGLTKSTGNLFLHVARHYRIEPRQIVHMGDNVHSDQRVPTQLGATVVPAKMRGRNGTFPSILEQVEPCIPIDDPLKEAGYRLVGPCCVAFARFIGRQLQTRSPRQVVFGARDTYLIKDIFDRLYPEVRTRYFRISRRAVYLADYGASGDSERLFEGRINADDFFQRIGLPTEPLLRGMLPRENRQRFLEAAQRSGLDELAANERETLVDYFKALGFEGEVAYVDLGWRGTLQDAMMRLIGQSCRIHGYYFGITKTDKDKTGFYFHGKRPLSRYHRIFQAIAAFEFLFTEPVASLKRIVREKEGFNFEDVCDETQEQIKSRNLVADGARQFFDDYMAVLGVVGKDDDGGHRAAIDRILGHQLLCPSPRTVTALGTMWHSHSFGGSHRETLCPSGSFNIRAYIDSTWRSAYVLAAAPDSRLIRYLHRSMSSLPGAFLVDLVRRCVNLVRRFREARSERPA